MSGGTLGQRRRVARERRTIAAMIALYCRDHHGGTGGLCQRCAALDAYAGERLKRCVFGVSKPTCANCPIHCYKRDMREAVREVMRSVGPRMLVRHPILAIAHLIHGRHPAPQLTRHRSRGGEAAPRTPARGCGLDQRESTVGISSSK